MIAADHICTLPPWFSAQGPESDVVVSTRVRLARNLGMYPFPRAASVEERKLVFDGVVAACAKSPAARKFSPVNFATLNKPSQELLLEEHAVSAELVGAEGDRGLVGTEDHRVGMMINEEDHIRFQAMDTGLCGARLLETLDSLDSSLGRHVQYAYDGRRGYLTACPTNAGTGLRVSFLLHLPGLCLTKAIDQVLQSATQMSMAARGYFGENSEIAGSLFQLSNQATMGQSEAAYLEATESFVKQVIQLERGARARLLEDAHTELSDKVWRAAGILLHARTLSVVEFLNLSSALRTGIDCGIIRGPGAADINRLTITVMPAHLQALEGRQMRVDELAALRAQTVRSRLKGTLEEV